MPYQTLKLPTNLFHEYFSSFSGITIAAAEVLGIQDKVGSIEVGKEANLVVLDQNPLEVDPTEIRNVKVIQRIFQGVPCDD